MSIGGILTCQSSSGNLSPFVHPYFCHLPDTIASAPGPRDKDNDNPSDKKHLLSKFTQSLALLKLETAWQAALELDGRHYWLALSHEAMDMLNIELALRVYRQLGDAGMVMSLEDCQHIEDRCVSTLLPSFLVCMHACVLAYQHVYLFNYIISFSFSLSLTHPLSLHLSLSLFLSFSLHLSATHEDTSWQATSPFSLGTISGLKTSSC